MEDAYEFHRDLDFESTDKKKESPRFTHQQIFKNQPPKSSKPLSLADLPAVKSTSKPLQIKPQPPVMEQKPASKFVHIEATHKIYVTNDLTRFGYLSGNRSLNKNKISRIIKEIEAGTNILRYCPIIVTEQGGKLVVFDGQHRLEVAKMLKSYIWYVMADPLNLYQVASVNSNTEKWSAKDYINCYSVTGNQNYLMLKEFTEKFNFPHSLNLQLLTKGKSLRDGSNEALEAAFKQGRFEVKSRGEAYSLANDVKQFEKFPHHSSRSFVMAIAKIVTAKKIGLDEIVRSSWTTDLVKENTWKEYLVSLEVIVNKNKKQRITIF